MTSMGALAQLTGDITALGSNINCLTTFPSREESRGIVTVKVVSPSQESLVGRLFWEGALILDAHECPEWGTEGYSAFHWTSKGEAR